MTWGKAAFVELSFSFPGELEATHCWILSTEQIQTTLVALSWRQPAVSWSALGHSSGIISVSVLQRPGTMDSVLSSRESFGKRLNSALAFPR